ncbi:virulence plasmid A protein [Amycolatopsis xylanica]|uniref:Virulence plasmid A protein n=1 Tax=Amycolatopsis xylanica TaxID=589385 RepID=A0A1H3REL2_9PSEU|nr:neuraminidase-like domain-containing protein [Amycolatopsis xylanica]SDZ23711.1 virulence plasmid A protein [Amycolatopsis xylanica]
MPGSTDLGQPTELIERHAAAGRVTHDDGTPASGVAVTVSARRLRSATPLGDTQTGPDGRYRIEFLAPESTVDIVVSASAGGHLAEGVALGAGPEATVDLVLPGAKRTEYETVLAAVTPLLDGATLGELGEDDVEYLARASGSGEPVIGELAAAARLSTATGLPAEPLFGLLRRGHPADLIGLGNEARTDLQSALYAAVDAKYIAQQADDAGFLAGLHHAAVKAGVNPADGAELPPIGELFTAAIEDSAAREHVYSVYLARTGDMAGFWQQLAEDPVAAPRLERLRLVFELGALTGDNMPLVRALLARFDTGELAHLRDLAKLHGEWPKLVRQAPAAFAVAAGEDDLDRYAGVLRDRVTNAYPTAYVAHQLSLTPEHVDPLSTRFLADNPEFDLVRTPVNEHSVEDPETRAELAGIQRAFKIAPRFEAMQSLRDNGFHSAHAVASIGRDAFAAQVSGTVGQDEAEAIHAKATRVHAAAVNLLADLRTAGHFDLPWLPSLDATATARIPDWESLFGSADYCACDECRTVYSQAAYLVDLLYYLKRLGAGVAPLPGGTTEGPVADTLYRRRDDLRDVELTCENTNLSLPYVDLVNEVLESAIAPDTAVPAKQRQSSGDAATLRVQPQHVNAGAYEKLRTAVYPWDLPFDLWREQTDASLAHLGVSRENLLSVLGPTPFSPDLLTNERLGLSTVAATIISGEQTAPPRTLAEHYGLAPGADPLGSLRIVRALLDSGSMRYGELTELLGTRFVNPGGVLRIKPDEASPYDTTRMTVDGLDTAALDRLHRFGRLRRVLGWSATLLDRVLFACHDHGRLDRAALRSIAAIRGLAARLDLPIEQVLTFYNPLETHRYATGDELPRYDRLFLDPKVVSLDPNPFALRPDRTELAVIGGLDAPEVAAALLGVLQVTDEDYTALTAVKPTRVLSLASLSALVRTVTLAKALSMSIPDLLRLIELYGEGGPFPDPLTGTRRHDAETELGAGAPMLPSVDQSLPSFTDGAESEPAAGAPIRPPAFLGTVGELPPTDALVGLTERFLDAVAAIQAAGFSVEDLNAVLADVVPEHGGAVPEDGLLAATLTTLRAALQAVYQQTAQTVDEKGELTRKDLALLGWDAALAQDAVATLLGTVTYRADLKALPDKVAFPPGIPVFHNVTEEQLQFTGPMNAEQYQALQRLSGDSTYLKALKTLHDAPRDFVVTRMKALRVPVYAAPLTAMPADLQLPEAFTGKIFFDISDHTLKCRGFLTAADVEALQSATKDPGFQAAVGLLQKNQEAAVAPENQFLTKADADAFFDSALSTPAARFSRVLGIVGPLLRRTLSETTVKQQLGQAAGLDPATADLLLGTWLRSASGSVVLHDFLMPKFIGSDPAVPIGRAAFGEQFGALALIHRVALLIGKLRVSAAELPFVFGHAGTAGWLDPSLLPSAPVSGASPLFGRFVRLLDLIRLRDSIPAGARALPAVFAVAATPGATTGQVVTELAERTGWNAADVAGVATQLDLVLPVRFASERNLLSLLAGIRLIQRLGVSAERVTSWLGADLTFEAAEAAWQAAKARHASEDWPAVAAPMRDRIRERQRSALVSYLVAKPLPSADGTPQWTNANGLHDYYLLDVEMGPTQQTTRIAQAIYSVQLFVQRCLLNLENQVTTTSGDLWAQWEWMKQYRLWEANQKVFLYPENYFEPDLRKGKSPFFRELEGELMQQEVTDETGDTSVRNYLEKLDGVDRLLPCGQAGSYLFARTESAPYTYYFRERSEGQWRPWERIDLDLDGNTPAPAMFQGRLYLFWISFTKAADSVPIVPNSSSPIPGPAEYWKLQLNWTQYFNGRWQPKKIASKTLQTNYVQYIPAKSTGFDPRATAPYRFQANIYQGTLRLECVYNDPVTDTPSRVPGWVVGRFDLSLRTGSVTVTPFRWTADLGGLFRYTPGVLAPPDTHTENNEFVANAVTSKLSRPLRPLMPEFETDPLWIDVLASTHLNEPYRLFNEFFTDDQRSYQVVGSAAEVWNPDVTTGISASFEFIPFYHPYVNRFIEVLGGSGIPGVLSRETQLLRADNFTSRYIPPNANYVKQPYPIEEVDFTYGTPYAPYNWELFFHSPLLVAERLSVNQRFAEAQRWFHLIFDPTTRRPGPAPDRFWQTKPFIAPNMDITYYRERIEQILKRLAEGDSAEAGAVENWLRHPFQPDAIAQLRTTAYQKAVVMKYLDNLIAWGDQLFRQDTLESINAASQLYLLASELLGRRPDDVPERVPAPASYRTLQAAPHAAAVTQVENLVPAADTVAPAIAPNVGLSWLNYFRIPRNEKLAGYWDTVADRLFKIRHGQNIDGVERALALFGVPIDPSLLVRATAAGLDLAAVLDDISSPLPHYRFGPMVAKAKELANEVKAFGSALLSALEKRDTEALGRLRSSHEVSVLKAARQVRALQVRDATEVLEGVRRSHAVAADKKRYYGRKKRTNDREDAFERLTTEALDQQETSRTFNMIASVISALPDVKIGTATTIGATWGSSNIIAGLRGISEAIATGAAMKHSRASLSSTLGGFDRRFEDWRFQARQAELEMTQLDSQIAGAEIRKVVAETELANHDKQIENTKEADRFLHEKYTNQELYDWMVGQLSTSYFQAYQLAYDVAKRAERAFRHELGAEDSNFVKFGYWDSLHKGLLAGERLAADLNRMDAAFLEANAREFELSKRISLAQLDTKALLSLKETGKCFVSLPEALFDLDTPGHYRRRIKSLSITVPCVAGPYTGVNLTATLLRSTVRVDPRLSNDQYGRQRADTRFRDYTGPIQSIVTSTGQDDSGLFETNLRDERFLPFEGAGAVSEWQLSLPDEFRQFDYDSISDVVLHLRYTARDGGSALAAPAVRELRKALTGWAHTTGKGLFRGFSARREFSDQWNRFLGTGKITFTLAKSRFPYLFRDEKFTLDDPQIVLVLSQDLIPDGTARYVDCYSAVKAKLTAPGVNPPEAALVADPALAKQPRVTFSNVSVELAESGQEWVVSLPVNQLDPRLLRDGKVDPEAVLDLMLICHYTLKEPARP